WSGAILRTSPGLLWCAGRGVALGVGQPQIQAALGSSIRAMRTRQILEAQRGSRHTLLPSPRSDPARGLVARQDRETQVGIPGTQGARRQRAGSLPSNAG